MERTTNHQVSHGGELRGTYKTPRRLQDNIFDVGNNSNTPFPYGTEVITSPQLRVAIPGPDIINPFLGVGNEGTAGNTPFPYGTEETGNSPTIYGNGPPFRIPIPDPVINPFLGVGNEGTAGNTPFPYGTEEIGDPPAVDGDVPPFRISNDDGN
jgi:hypothetical protein